MEKIKRSDSQGIKMFEKHLMPNFRRYEVGYQLVIYKVKEQVEKCGQSNLII